MSNETFTHNGREYQLETEQDDCLGHPWKEHDGHGSVRECRSRHEYGSRERKRPGERPLNQPDRHDYQYFYDWNAAMRTAVADGWGVKNPDGSYGRLPGESARAHAARAVQADFDFLRRYVAGDVLWQVITVTSPSGKLESLGGILAERGDDCIMEAAHELAGELEARDNEARDHARARIATIARLHHAFWRGLAGDKGSADVAVLAIERCKQLRQEAHDLVAQIRQLSPG